MSAAVTSLPRDRADYDLEALRAELEEKDKTLILAGQYGRKLLEERDNLKCELDALKEDNNLLRKRLEVQEQDAQESKSAAQVQISQLEEDLDRANISEETASSTDLQQSLELLNMEKEQLKEDMAQMVRHHTDELELMKRKLEVREKETGLMKSEVANFKKKMSKLEEEKQELERCVMLKQHSCEQLAAELQITKQEAEAWEYQCICNEQLLKSQDNELDSTRDMLLQLQQEVNLKESLLSPTCSTPKSNRTSSSLFDELSNKESEPVDPQAVPAATATPTSIAPVQTERSDESEGARHSSVSISETSTIDTSVTSSCAANPSSSNSKAEKCSRCAELQSSNQRQQEEIEAIKKQLLAVIQQKIKLHEQVEAWQSDVEEMLGSKVKLQLDNLSTDNKKSKSNKRRGLLRGSKIEDSSKVKKLSPKNSWTSS